MVLELAPPESVWN